MSPGAAAAPSGVAAPSLADARAAGILPDHAACRRTVERGPRPAAQGRKGRSL